MSAKRGAAGAVTLALGAATLAGPLTGGAAAATAAPRLQAHPAATAPAAPRLTDRSAALRAFSVRVAAGASAPVTVDRTVFAADRGFAGGRIVRRARSANPLTRAARVGSTTFSAAVPSAGVYRTTLTLPRSTVKGATVDVVAESRTVAAGVGVGPAPRSASRTLAVDVPVTDGRLNLRLVGHRAAAAVSAVTVVWLAPVAGSGATGPGTATTATPATTAAANAAAVPAQGAAGGTPVGEPTASTVGPPTWVSGVYPGGDLSAAAATAFGGYRGSPVAIANVSPVRDSWATIRDNTWAIDQYAGFPGRLTLSVPLLASDHTATLADVAAGAHDADFASFARNLVAKGRGTSVVRLGWEFDGDWTPWAARDAATYKAAFRRVVGVLRSNAPGIAIDWCGTVGESHVGHNPFTDLYPGDDVVDIVGVDAYATHWHDVTDDASWVAYRGMVNGLDAWLAFARAHGKPLSVPEWGLFGDNRDNPLFVQKMHDFFAANAGSLAYEAYFNEPMDYIHDSLTGPVQNPRASELYARLW